MIDGKAEERAGKIVLMIRAENTSALARSQIQEVADEIGAAVEEATTKDRSEIEDLIWNLAGCSTFALGYGLDEPFDKSKARAAIFDVHTLALKYRTAKAEAYEDAAKIAEMYLIHDPDDGQGGLHYGPSTKPSDPPKM